MAESDQAKDVSSTKRTEALRQPTEISLIQATLETAEIPARNIEVLKAAEAEQKAVKRAENEARMEEQEIWGRIASEVRNCGVPIEVLGKHESRIASCVIDTFIDVLKTEQKHDQDKAANLDVPLAADALSVTAGMVKSGTTHAEPDSLARNSILGAHTKLIDEEVAKSPTKVTELQPSSTSPSTSEIEVLPEKAASRLQGLRRSGTSCIKRMFSGRIVPEGYMPYLTPDSSVHSEEEEDVRSNDGESPSSSVTSLNEDDVQVGKEEDADEKVSVQSVVTIAEDEEGEGERREGEAEEDEDEEDDDDDDVDEAEVKTKNRATEETNDHGYSAYTKGPDQEDGPVESSSYSKVYDPCDSRRVEADDVDKASKSGIISATGKEMGDVEVVEESVAGDNNGSEAGDKHDVGEDEDEVEDEEEGQVSPIDEDEDGPHEQVEFIDHGHFDPWTIINVLGKGDLDELRMLRLKEGFFRLLEQC